MLRICMGLGLFVLGQGVSMGASTVVINNLTQPTSNKSFPFFVGQSFIDGPSDSVLSTVSILTAMFGTVDSTLFSGFGESFNSGTHLLTFTASPNFVLSANTGYFLVLSDAAASMTTVSWDFSASQTFNPQNGFSLPATNTSFAPLTDNGVSVMPERLFSKRWRANGSAHTLNPCLTIPRRYTHPTCPGRRSL